MLSFDLGCLLLHKILWFNTFIRQMDEANWIFQDKLQPPGERTDLIFFSPGSLHQISPINVKREIRGLQEVKKKKKTQWTSTAISCLINLLAW